MKSMIAALICSAVFLSIANIYLRNRPYPSQASAATPSAPAKESQPSSNIVASVASAPVNPAAAPTLHWEKMETTDYKAYIQNLRQVGFPEELIREIIIADVNKMYAPREEPLKTKPVPFDAPLSARRRDPTVEDVQNLMQLRDLQIEKQDLLQQLLGVAVPREIIRTPNSRNYEAAEFAVRQLPPEKQQEALRIFEQEILLDDLAQARGLQGDEFLATYRQINETRNAALQSLLTPEEFNRFIMNATPPGAEMQRRVMGMEPTDQELLAMWQVTHEQWQEQGGVFGRWRAVSVPEEQIRAADEKLEQGLRSALGPDRYLDYQMATSGTGQQLRNFASRYNLPRETLANAFDLQKQIDSIQRSTRAQESRGLPSPFSPDGAADQRLIDVQRSLENMLGPDLYGSWTDGRNQKYDWQP